MIGFVQGRIADIQANSCIVLTEGGVGYRLFLPAHTLALLESGSSRSFHTCMTVRENAIELFGFETQAERQAFDILRAINKIGARTALAILSACRPDDLGRMVAEDNLAALTKIPGIGKKTGQHILLELKNRLPGRLDTAMASPGSQSGLYGDVLAALANLGYAESECSGTVADIVNAEPDLDVGSAIRLALKELGRK